MEESDAILESTIAEVEEPTPEGLAVRRSELENRGILLQEIGHFDFVICEHRIFPPMKYDEECGFWIGGGRTESGIEFIAARLADLDRRCRTLESQRPTSIDLPLWKRNRRAARRRLRRWLSTHQPTTLTLPPELQEVVRDVTKSAPEKEFEFQMEMVEKNLDLITDYERRKADAIVLLVTDIPERLRGLMEEAREAYFLGFARVTIVLCRAVLEELLKDLLQRKEIVQKAMPLFEDRLEVLINCLPTELLKPIGRQWAHEIRRQGNDALHNAAAFSDQDALAALTRTTRIVEVLLNRVAELQGKGSAAT